MRRAEVEEVEVVDEEESGSDARSESGSENESESEEEMEPPAMGDQLEVCGHHGHILLHC